jgi:hypothetical protein
MSQPKDDAATLNWHERATVEARRVLEAMDTSLELTDACHAGKHPRREESSARTDELSLTFVMKPRDCKGA